jgi:peptidylprolyl isomerase
MTRAVLVVALAATCLGGAGTPLTAQQQVEFAPALGVDLATMQRTNRGVHFRDLKVGEGPVIGSAFTVTIHYTGWLPDGTQFETSRQDNVPVTFALSDRRVIRGWEEGIRGMRQGGVRLIVVPPALAYGRRGLAPVIPPEATLVFEIEVVRAAR